MTKKNRRKYKGRKFLNASYFGGPPKTIGQFNTRTEANNMRYEYLLTCGPGWRVWISQRPYKGYDDDN